MRTNHPDFYFQIYLFLLSGFSLQAQEFSVSTIPDSLKKNVHSVLRYEHLSVYVKNNYDMTVSLEYAITVLNDKGNSAYQLGSPYSKSQKITHMSAEVFDATGKEIRKLKQSDLVDRSAIDGFSVFRDDRVKYFIYEPGSYPYTMVFKLEVKSENTAFLPDWNPLSNEFQSVEKSTYMLNYPPEWKLQVSEHNFDAFGVVRNESPGIYRLQMENRRPVSVGYAAPPEKEYLPYATPSLNHFQLEGLKGTADNWSEFGSWYSNHFLNGYDSIPAQTQAEIKQLIEGLTDSVEMIKKIYQYVQQKTRYVSVQIGIGGWKPMTVQSVDELKYGDCKALSFYTASLLRKAGFDATYTIVFAGDIPQSIDSTDISVQGSHAIVSVPLSDTTIWLETTNPYCPFGYLGTFTDDRVVISLSPGKTKAAKTPSIPDSANRQNTVAHISLAADGSIIAHLNMWSEGIQYDDKYHLELRKKEDKEKHYQHYWDYLQMLKMNNIQFENDKNNIRFTEIIDLEAQKYGVNSGERMLVPAVFFNRSTFIPPREPNRTQDLLIYRGFYDTDSCWLALPEGYVVEALPKPLGLVSKFGSYRLTVSTPENNKLLIVRHYMTKRGRFSAAEYPEYLQFKKDIARFDQSKIVLKKSEP